MLHTQTYCLSNKTINIDWDHLSSKANMFIKDVVDPQLCDTYDFTFGYVEALPDGFESFVTDLLENACYLGIWIISIEFYSGLTDEFNVWNSNL